MSDSKNGMPAEKNDQVEKNDDQQYSLNDDRRVKVLSPGALIAKRFFRNRLAVVGLVILVVMFLFSFVGGLVSPYGQDETFSTTTQLNTQYAGITETTTRRYTADEGADFGALVKANANTAINEGAVNAIVSMSVLSGHTVTATISMAAVKDLGLTVGCDAVAVIKATSVMFGVNA